MNCLPLNLESLSVLDGTFETLDHYFDDGVGCFGGNGMSIYNWLVATGSRMPTLKQSHTLVFRVVVTILFLALKKCPILPW
jgi:hypothetical protein